mmetsp:Transcript_33943/g.54453  ORF Transcript_33943/g.54453 Transcript_33943/m.54453 type:complete len:176 (+) Transcript_33943:129-656(+)
MFATAVSAASASAVRAPVAGAAAHHRRQQPRASIAVPRRSAKAAGGGLVVVATASAETHARGRVEAASGGERHAALRKLGGGAAFFVAGFAALAVAATTPGPASANVKYANDCDPICHILDDGAAKSQKVEAETRASGPDMGSAMARLQAERKATEAAEKKAAAAVSGEGKPRGF